MDISQDSEVGYIGFHARNEVTDCKLAKNNRSYLSDTKKGIDCVFKGQDEGMASYTVTDCL